MGNRAPIGVFDSGVGGLTVVRALRGRIPSEALIYLGDTARVPYGTKSPDVVRRYALNCARFLVGHGAKVVVVACNTASAVATEEIRDALATEVIGVIEPGAQMAAAATRRGLIGVIGTEGTIASGRYQAAITALNPDARVIATACPLFVPLAEEGMATHPATRMLAEEYLAPMIAEGVDTLVLGCTHYPLLEPLIADIVGGGVTIINSATAVAEVVDRVLDEQDLRSAATQGSARFFATDVAERFRRVGSAFLGEPIDEMGWVDL